eukprot:TRINITY_DN689_c0_g1_i1.p1 TRINITY_DN689_c0_g1~~TRINITY_DN689_c0_g1_i1.p1  ORF type:complete len:2585 (-),score=436.87 TRINITY_DN689_c0_g1_i1:90-7844(-)
MAWALAVVLLWGNVLCWASGGEAAVSYSMAVPSSVRAGEPFTIEVVGANFDTYNDKIILVPTSSNCGDVDVTPPVGKYRSVAEYENLVCAGGGSAATKLVCKGVNVYEKGRFRVCVCDADALYRPYVRPPSPPVPAAAPGTVVSGSTTANWNASDAHTSTTMSSTTSTTMSSTMTQTTTTATYNPCNVASRFWLGSGSTVSVEGVQYAGSLAWRAGAEASLQLTGTKLSSRDRIRIVEGSIDCADPSKSKAMHAAVSGTSSFPVASGERYEGSEFREAWKGIVVHQQGLYNLCWCAAGLGDCDSDEDFPLRAARIIVSGPTAGLNQRNACVTGVVCTLQVFGSGLADTDRIHVISKSRACGNALQTSAVVIGGGISNPRTSGSEFVSRFGGVVMGSQGSFKLCWCGSYDPVKCPTCCSNPADYNIFVGLVTVGGPIQGGIETPPIGVPFEYAIRGWGLSDVDRISIVDDDVECASPTANRHSSGIESSTVPFGPPTRSEGPGGAMNRTMVSWQRIVAREIRGYRVCWCAHFFSGCSEGAHYALDIGLIMPRGPANTTFVDAIPGRPFDLLVTAATGSLLSLNDRIRIVDRQLSQGRCGGSGSRSHSPAVSDLSCWPTCVDSPIFQGPALSADNLTELWKPVLLTQPGTYDLCWCNAGQGGCDSDQDFLFKVGVIVANGVTTGSSWYCAAYMPCFIQVPLTDGLLDTDMVQLVADVAGNHCGHVTRASSTSFSRGTRVTGYEGRADDKSKVMTFEFGNPQAPGVYKACYCQGTVCNSDQLLDRDFFQTAGKVVVMGLFGRDDYHKCYLREKCKLNIQGAGLGAQDAVMLLDPFENCGQNGRPSGFTTDGPEYYASTGDRVFIGTKVATSEDGLESWHYELGAPIRVGRHRVCYCSHARSRSDGCNLRSDFDQNAGEIFVRGSEFSAEVQCQQGEPCTIVARGHTFNALDRIVLLKTGENHSCGMADNGAYASWISPTVPQTITPDTIIPDLWAASWSLASVREPGNFLVCYCAYIIGGTACIEQQSVGQDVPPPVSRYRHEIGKLKVTGSILAVRQVGAYVASAKSPLPATPHAVSVEVDSMVAYLRFTCVATSRPAPTGFVPRKSDLQNCSEDVTELSQRQQMFPRCWGIGKMTEAVTEIGATLVHVPVHLTELALQSAKNFHVWCFGSDLCSNDRCVMPATNEGLKVPRTGGLRSLASVWTATVGMPFALRVQLVSDFNIGKQWPRIKIVPDGKACDSTLLSTAVTGITCVESGVGKCEPEPVAMLSSVSWGAGRELVWDKISVARAAHYGVCYCDRHYDQTCIAWLNIGKLTVQGPFDAGALRYYGNPGKAFEIVVHGNGLASADRLRIIPGGVACTAAFAATTTGEPLLVSPDTTTIPTSGNGSNNSNSSRRLQRGALDLDWRSGSPSFANGSLEGWGAQIADLGVYTVCWCGGVERSCEQASDFALRLGTVEIATQVDCKVTEWWTVVECNRECGGGKVTERRAITQQAAGGGKACPSTDELFRVRDCNMKPCPLARLDRVLLLPETLTAGQAFQVQIEGDWLDPTDRILLLSENEVCGKTQVHHGGASCDQEGSLKQRLVCGDGANSIRVQQAGRYKICVCDASASRVRSFDGTTEITTGGFEAAGRTGEGCASPDLYVLQPTEGAILTVNPAPVTRGDSDSAGSGELSDAAIVAITTVVVLSIILIGVASYCWVRSRMTAREMARVADSSAADTNKEDKETPPGVDPQMLAYYESYYQSMGYPPGTAAQAFGGGAAQLALPAPMAPGGLVPPPGPNPALTNGPNDWMTAMHAPRPPTLPLALPPPRPPGSIAPQMPIRGGRSPRAGGISPRNDGRSPRGLAESKSFGDLVSETNRRPSMQLPMFTDTELPKMPTPTVTPRAITPRASDRPIMALEDGRAEDGEAPTPGARSNLSRPGTSDSVLSGGSLALSESTVFSSPGPSRPGTGGSVGSDTPVDAQQASGSRGSASSPLSPVKEEEEESGSMTKSNLKSFFNDRMGIGNLFAAGSAASPDDKSGPSPPVPPDAALKPPGPAADANRKAAEDAQRKAAEEAAKKQQEEDAKRAEEAAKQKARDEEQTKKAEEEARKKDEEARQKAEMHIKQKAEDEARRQAEEEAARQREEARKLAEEEAKKKAEQDAAAKRIAEEAEAERRADAARIKAEEDARIKAEEAARLKAEEEARLKAEEEARIKAEQEARIKAEEEARIQAQEEARRQADEERKKAEAEREEQRKKEEEEARKKREEEEEAAKKKKMRVTSLWSAGGMAALVGATPEASLSEGPAPLPPPPGGAWDAPLTPTLGSKEEAYAQLPKPELPKEEPAEESRPVTPPVLAGTRLPPPPPPKSRGPEPADSWAQQLPGPPQSPSAGSRPPPPPPPPGRKQAPNQLSLEDNAEAGEMVVSPQGQRVNYSLASLAATHQHSEGSIPSAGSVPTSPTGSSAPPPPPPGRPPKDPNRPLPPGHGPGPVQELDLEDTLQSNFSVGSANSGSPSGSRKKNTLGGIARSLANVVDADTKAGREVKGPSPSSSNKPKRAAVPTRRAMEITGVADPLQAQVSSPSAPPIPSSPSGRGPGRPPL